MYVKNICVIFFFIGYEIVFICSDSDLDFFFCFSFMRFVNFLFLFGVYFLDYKVYFNIFIIFIVSIKLLKIGRNFGC